MTSRESSDEKKGSNSSTTTLISFFKGGLTWRSLLALMYIVFVFQPGLAYLHLQIGGVPVMGAIQWATILLFIEICSITGNPLTINEAIIIYLASGQTIKYWWFLAPEMGALSHPGWIYQAYLKYSPYSQAFGIADKIPSFYSPSYEVFMARTLIHPEWMPILLNTIAFYVAAMFGDICLTILAYILYARVEQLPFPTARPVVEATETLIQRDWKRMGAMVATASFAAIYGLIIYVAPLLSTVLWGVTISIVPVPWVDLNSFIQLALPGASFGIATDLAIMTVGFIIPFKVVLGSLIGSITAYLVGNYLLVSNKITGLANEYVYGMPIQTLWQRSVLHVWAMPMIGMGIAVGIMPLVLHPNILRRTFSALRRLKTESPLGFSVWWIIIPFIIATLGLSLFDWWLAPDCPLPILIFLNVVWPFISMLIVARAQGLGVSVGVPYMREMTFRASGYPGINAWFVPIYAPSPAAEPFKICEMTKTKLMDYVKAQYIIFPIALIAGFFFMQSLWSIAPIPSYVYPGVLMSWPVQATFQSLLVSPEAGVFFEPTRILYGLLAGSIIYAVADRVGFAATAVGIASGLSSAPPYPVATFIGAIIGRLIAKMMGKEWWDKYRGVMYAGVLLGEGIMVVAGSAVAIIARGMWAAPY
ncbi:MAG: hypothetical protein RMJ07_06660 [Nitrososphaerota archaeon]|nr:hypothetical protein [Candidatus Bathyarchaeota archaeon]MDW8049336.1 hypothetical protein [Nitrososphaerota archaeon]